ncbi:MNIO class RiPP chryseobasin precursor ChrA [Chryseobacterium sp. M5A1_1a]
MKIPTLLMVSLLAVGVSAQTTKSSAKTKQPTKKARKVAASDTAKKPKPTTTPKVIVRKDTVLHDPRNCPACGMG